MIYIIHNRKIWIFYENHTFREYLTQMYLPSWREEHLRPITMIRL